MYTKSNMFNNHFPWVNCANTACHYCVTVMSPMDTADTQSGTLLEAKHKCDNCQFIRSSSADEIANVNFFNDQIVHVLQNTINSCINSATVISAA